MRDFSEQLCEVISVESGMDAAEIAASAGLMSAGILDSFGLVAVISLVETHLGQEIPPADLVFANFDSVAAICAYVERAHGI
jgi:acyl carrier protein